MKNQTKTVCAVAMLIAVSCTKEITPLPDTTNANNGISSLTDSIRINLTDSFIINLDSIRVTIPSNGTNGSNGTNDTNRTEVLYSDWLTPGNINPIPVPSPTGTGNGSGSGTNNGNTPSTPVFTQFFNVDAPFITQYILDKGVVLAYCKLQGDGNNVRQLATTMVVSGFLNFWDFRLTVGRIQFAQTTTNPAGIPAISSSNKFRYVIIPPTRHLRLSKPIKDMTYDEICNMFGIPK